MVALSFPARFGRIAFIVSLTFGLLLLLYSAYYLRTSACLDSTLGSTIPLLGSSKHNNIPPAGASSNVTAGRPAGDAKEDKEAGSKELDPEKERIRELERKKDLELSKDFPFPKKIWQTDKSLKIKPEAMPLITSWYEKNPTFRYELLNDYGAEEYVREQFKDFPKLRDAYLKTPDPILRADMLRIMVMYASGGVYSDTDTECLVPVTEWVPKEYWGKANLVVGFETERSRDKHITQEKKNEVKVCQWTLLSKAKSKHVLGIMDHIVDNMYKMAKNKGVTFEELGKKLTIPEVIWATGPAEVTLALQASLSKSLGETIDRRNMSGHLKPFLLDDVLFLPVNAFAGHQQHSHSGSPELGPLFVKHYYGSSWWKSHGQPS